MREAFEKFAALLHDSEVGGKVGVGQLQPFLEICALTGSAREEHARRGDRFVLARQVETVYTAELLPCDDWDGAVDEETVKKSFSLIVAEWTTGEN